MFLTINNGRIGSSEPNIRYTLASSAKDAASHDPTQIFPHQTLAYSSAVHIRQDTRDNKLRHALRLLTEASKVWACGKTVAQLTAQLHIAVNPRAPSSKGFRPVRGGPEETRTQQVLVSQALLEIALAPIVSKRVLSGEAGEQDVAGRSGPRRLQSAARCFVFSFVRDPSTDLLGHFPCQRRVPFRIDLRNIRARVPQAHLRRFQPEPPPDFRGGRVSQPVGRPAGHDARLGGELVVVLVGFPIGGVASPVDRPPVTVTRVPGARLLLGSPLSSVALRGLDRRLAGLPQCLGSLAFGFGRRKAKVLGIP